MLIAGGVAAGGGVVAWRLVLHDDARPAEVRAAVARFRATRVGSTKRGLAEAGVYVYATTGFERISFGGLEHAYPARSTITITPTRCGIRLRWDVLTARRTAWNYCLGARGLVRTGSRELHRFYDRNETTVYVCGRGWLLVPLHPRTNRHWPLRCADAQGGRERGTGSVVGFATLHVAGRAVRTVHVRLRATLAGRSEGTAADDYWLRTSDRLPVRIVTRSDTATRSPIGAVRYAEQATLTLVSPEPLR